MFENLEMDFGVGGWAQNLKRIQTRWKFDEKSTKSCDYYKDLKICLTFIS